MVLLKYLVSKDQLPNPRGILSAEIPSLVMSQINCKVVAKTTDTSSSNAVPKMLVQHSHSLFCRYSPKTCTEIRKYTYCSTWCNCCCSRKFSKQLGHPVHVSTVHSINIDLRVQQYCSPSFNLVMAQQNDMH